MISSSNKPPVFCLMGPTASGKTDVAMALYDEFPVELVSVDSAQIYTGLDIGSGKPQAEILKQYPHHLIDIRDPAVPYSASDFRQDVIPLIKDIHSRKKIPVLVGGTMLYFKVLRDGLAPMPPANAEIRNKIIDLASQKGWQAVHNRLKEVDPESAIRIHPNDPQRLQRALEVYEASGKPMSDHHRADNLSNKNDLSFSLIETAIFPQERQLLHERIEQRFLQMIELGFIEEVKELHQRSDLNSTLPAIRSVGYRQIWDYLEDSYDYDTIISKGIVATRQLAKRQLTWLRGWPNLETFDLDHENSVKKSKNILSKLIECW